MRAPRPPLLDPIAWRRLRVFAVFDLPVETKADRRAYGRFRKACTAPPRPSPAPRASPGASE